MIDLYRQVINAEFSGPDRIQATFLTRYVLRGHVFGDEYLGHGHLIRHGGAWQIAESTYASNATEVTRVLVPQTPPRQSE